MYLLVQIQVLWIVQSSFRPSPNHRPLRAHPQEVSPPPFQLQQMSSEPHNSTARQHKKNAEEAYHRVIKHDDYQQVKPKKVIANELF